MTDNQGTSIYDRRKQPKTVELLADRKKTIDPSTGRSTVKLFTGDWHLSQANSNELLATILGSCISACIRDPLIGIGGMNHFLIPDGNQANNPGLSTRFGVNAMEQLLNAIYKMGGRKERLEIKVFGGGNVTGNSLKMGSTNSNFIRKFLADEGFKIAAEDLEGDLPRRLQYMPDTGKVMLRKLRRQEDLSIVAEEKAYEKKLITVPEAGAGEIDLF